MSVTQPSTFTANLSRLTALTWLGAVWSALARHATIARMVTCDVSGAEAKGFQVSVTGPSGATSSVILTPCRRLRRSLTKRVIDADRLHSTPTPPTESI